MDLESAAEEILIVVRCKYKLESQGPCYLMLCQCQKHGLKCVTASKHCNGEACENIELSKSNIDDGKDSELDDDPEKEVEPVNYNHGITED